ncbi:fructuronate reductase [Loktanella ponticola]|uniref:Fructuronate reductase n=1 Tax=Yoonia ponticola TaxID=1524255 RepID=A0A7W9BJS5_9RHOB|nr:mannitol dehydrogenase family protein [Yoonia ponticola]MBB5721532.1 fructuronate reductase [Yoonia ponticola]
MSMKRLAHLDDISGAAVPPAYDPAAHGCGIVHLGLGAFHRAHQAAMTDAALAADGGDWRITGVGLRSRTVVDALEEQNCLYTLLERDEAGVTGRVIGSIAKAIAADPAATLAVLCAPETRIVTLTVTEKGYGIDRATGGPDTDNPVIAADLANLDAPSGVLGLLTVALSERRARGCDPFTVLCCDNLPDNGKFLKGGIVGFARLYDAGLADWIDGNVAFPSSMVDRITPAASDATLLDAQKLTGCSDLCAIETEPFTQWVIEDNFPQGRPAWEHGGAIFVDDVDKFERMKLRMLNGAHSMLAYAGFLSGHRYVRDVMANAALAKVVQRHLQAAAQTLEPLPMIDFETYAHDLEARFRNPAIAHETYQIAMDGTQKLPQRIFAPAMDAIAAGQSLRPFALATAAWMRYALGVDEAGKSYDLRDPREAEIKTVLADVPRDGERISAALHEHLQFVPRSLVEHAEWRETVAAILGDILDKGIGAVILAESDI